MRLQVVPVNVPMLDVLVDNDLVFEQLAMLFAIVFELVF